MLGMEQAKRMKATYLRERGTEFQNAVVVCINSLVNLVMPLDLEWDLIIIDECDLVRKTFAASTMDSVRWQTIDYLRKLLLQAKTVVICQAEISASCGEFYADPMGIDTNSRDRLTALKIVKPESSHPIEFSQDMALVTQIMIHRYVTNLVPLKPNRSPHDEGDGLWYEEEYEEVDGPFTVACLYTEPTLDKIIIPKLKPLTSSESRSDDRSLPREVGGGGSTVATGTLTWDESSADSGDSLQEPDAEPIPSVVFTHCLKRPFVVFTTKKTHGLCLTILMQKIAVKLGADPHRIKFISADTKLENVWHRKFCSNPGLYSKDADVLITTGVMGAGISLDDIYSMWFAFLHIMMPHTEEEQFVARVR